MPAFLQSVCDNKQCKSTIPQTVNFDNLKETCLDMLKLTTSYGWAIYSLDEKKIIILCPECNKNKKVKDKILCRI